MPCFTVTIFILQVEMQRVDEAGLKDGQNGAMLQV